MSYFGSLFSKLFSHQHDQKALPDPSVEELETELEEVMQRLQKQTAALTAESRRHHLEDELEPGHEARDQSRRRMEEEILQMHQRLSTGLGKSDLERLSTFMTEHAHPPKASGGLALEVDAAVVEHLYERVGELAWRFLSEAMQRENLEWELSAEMLHGRDPDSTAKLKKQRRQEMRRQFLTMPMLQTADEIRGEVKSWSTLYPEPGTWLWNETVLQGVGAALRARFYEVAMSLWENRTPSLDRLLQRMMSQHLEEASRALRSGVHSLEEANRMLADLRKCCREKLPQMVWAYLEPRLQAEFESVSN